MLTQTIPEAGATVGYQHWWLPNLRSTVAYGIEQDQIPSQLIGPVQATVANNQIMTAHGNLIWSPAAFIDAGVEYVWGRRKVVANIYGQEQAVIGKFRVKF